MNTITWRVVIINGNVIAARFQQQVLLPFVIPHLRAGSRGMVMLQGTRSHSSCITQDLLQQQNVRQRPIPPRSPDLNIIKLVRWTWKAGKETCSCATESPRPTARSFSSVEEHLSDYGSKPCVVNATEGSGCESG